MAHRFVLLCFVNATMSGGAWSQISLSSIEQTGPVLGSEDCVPVAVCSDILTRQGSISSHLPFGNQVRGF